ncbi:MAG TPA: histidine phosphatase family protein [Geminicoccaceae bacterium]|nr:histidine phosphatase family protein [Geminicoccaceae bacterium]
MGLHAADWWMTVEEELKRGIEEWGVAFELRSPSFWFLRHGRTASNVQGLIQGHADVGLDGVGRQEARDAGRSLSLGGFGVRRIVASDLSRASDTARLVAEALGLPAPEIDPRLRERCFGALQGKVVSQAAWLSDDAGVETPASFARRTIEAVMAAVTGPEVMICAHGGTLRVLAAATGLRLGEAYYRNATPLQFNLADGQWSCERPTRAAAVAE